MIKISSHFSALNALTLLLNENNTTAQQRQATLFDNMASPLEQSLVLYGAGSLGKKVLGCLRQHGVNPLAFADNNPSKWGSKIEGIVVLSPQEASAQYAHSAAFVVTVCSPGHSYNQTKEKLLALGCTKVVPVAPLMWKYPENLCPHYAFDLPDRLLKQADEILQAFNLFEEPESQQLYTTHVQQRLLSDFDCLPFPTLEEQYFPQGIISLQSDEVFVDCGAYNGDTINKFIGLRNNVFKKIFAFEPDPQNYNKLTDYIKTLEPDIRKRIESYPFAVGAQAGYVFFNAIGATGASVNSGGTTPINCVTIDLELHSHHPTFLKFDIEGAEQDALIGSRNLIQHRKPIVAVCVYHRPDDLWKIPLYLNSLYEDYRFFLRAHSYDGWELVLYAIPPHRLHLNPSHER